MTDAIEMICNLSGASREDAEKSYAETRDIVESVDKLMVGYAPIQPKVKILSEAQVEIQKLREITKASDDKMYTPLISLDQRDCEESSEMQALPEETSQQSGCSQQYRPEVLESGVERQEIVCPLLSEYSCDLPSIVRTLPETDLQCLQPIQAPN